MHPDLEQIQRLLHDELAPQRKHEVREHLALCSDCRARVEVAEREDAEVNALLRHLDQAAPQAEATAIAGLARARVTRGRWAAGLLLSLGVASTAYALPGSPLRTWWQAIVAPPSNATQQPESTSSATPAPDAGSGIAVSPGQQFVILFAGPQSEGNARISLGEGEEVIVRTLTGSARFTSDDDRLVIDNRGSSADFEIEIPRTAARVEIRIDNRTVFQKNGPRVTTEAPAYSPGSYRLPLTAPRGR